jgi:hypothetical protein
MRFHYKRVISYVRFEHLTVMRNENYRFLDMTPCSLADVLNILEKPAVSSCTVEKSILKMEVVGSSETLVLIHQTTVRRADN